MNLNSNKKTLGIVYLIIFILWSFYRYYFDNSEWLDEFIFKPILWIWPLILINIIFKNKITKEFAPYSIITKNILLGLGAAIFLYFVLILSGSIISNNVIINPSKFNLNLIVLNLLISLATAIVEEFTFRGYFLKNLFNSKNQILAVVISNFLFVFIHLPGMLFKHNYNLTDSLTYLLILSICGFGYSFAYLRTKSLFTSVSMHGFWNFLSIMIK